MTIENSCYWVGVRDITFRLVRPWSQRAGLAPSVLTSWIMPPSVLGPPAFMMATMTLLLLKAGSISAQE